MNGPKQGERRRRAGAKRPYRAPRLVVHGDIGALTRTKKGTSNDGARKPRTKRTGGNA